ncbi:S1C family serine protease [Alkalicoccus luteus]|uniref:Trypsin-like peptidase domain-containing protein n=1 Tax=Alkalicoccus luteus TaxID=1237094 RepID=A0A969TUG9_9BACI|nr:serine protease [Alkalicoccus luteus]NJP37330.1 trypsin-like peptidase domain-containing protein [Alkalicoccus luteus]
MTDDDKRTDQDDAEQNGKKEELFYDGEQYLTKEEFFNPSDPVEPEPKKKMKRGLKISIASVAAVALLANVLAVWPQLINIPAFHFLSNAYELRGDEEVQDYQRSIVVIRSGDAKGTGFVFDDGRIMTNQHVVDQNAPISVHFEDGTSYQADIELENEDFDTAVLEADFTAEEHPALEFGSGFQQGEEITIIGNPRFFNFVPNSGITAGYLDTAQPEPVIALDAPVYRGSSGSPVINHQGEVIGVVYATTTRDGERFGLAVDMNIIHERVLR